MGLSDGPAVAVAALVRGAKRWLSCTSAGRVLGLAVLLFGTLRLLVTLRLWDSVPQRWRPILWPNSQYDDSRNEPLPPGSMGCPIFGLPFFWGSKDWGAGSFYLTTSNKLGWPRLFKYYFMGCAFVAVSGLKNLQLVLNKEFEPEGIASALHVNELFGRESLAAERSKDRHQFLRRLVGQPLAPAAVTSSIPVLQGMAMDQINCIRESCANGPVLMDRFVTDYTFNIAWKQILGLDLSADEVPDFFRAAFKSLKYLESKISQKIDDLERDGPDGVSTLSGMVFATDEDAEKNVLEERRKLSRAAVIDNVMLLILAGSETSSSTLANTMLMLGLHRGAWNKLVEEQRRVQEKFGDALTMEALDKDATPYLEAVIREALRLRPVSGGFPRVAKETLVVEGKKIPKGWYVDWCAVLTHELDPVTFEEDGSHMDVRTGFRPERWLSDSTVPSEFVPFGQGPRYCLGSHLAYTEMKVFLSLFARSFDFELSGNNAQKVAWKNLGIIAKVQDGLPVTVRPVATGATNPSYGKHV